MVGWNGLHFLDTTTYLHLLSISIYFESAWCGSSSVCARTYNRACVIYNTGMMTSIEPARITGYSPDIGWRVVWEHLSLNYRYALTNRCGYSTQNIQKV